MRNDAEALAMKYGLPLVVSFAVIGLRSLFSAKRWTVVGIIRGVLMACLVAWLAPPWLDNPSLGLDPDEQWLAVAICAVFVEDIFIAMMRLGVMIQENPVAFVKAALALITKGRK